MSYSVFLKKGLYQVPFFFLSLLLCLQTHATSLIPPKELNSLAQSQEWKNLLRYERALITPWKKHSAIRDKDFFFAEDGYKNSLAELQATLIALNKPFSEFKDINKHPLCRFPARFQFLKTHTNKKTTDLKLCTEYQRWNEGGQINSISIYFATGYFGNPASFFGHPLLKFNKKKDSASNFTDTSLNYGAMTPANENPIFYVLKGLLGGYTASFTRHDFYYHNHNYLETEMRDLWEYRLNLTPTQVQQFVDRSWELLGKNHPYYFLADNCAYRMGQLLEEIFQTPIIFRNHFYVIPIDLFDGLASGKRPDGKALVSSIKRVPSRYSRLAKQYLALNSDGQKWVQEIIEDQSKLSLADFTNQEGSQRARILETLISYYTFRKLSEKGNAKIEEKRIEMIRHRFKVKATSGFKSLSYQEAKPPHESVSSFGIGLSQGHSELRGSFQELTLRPALYDELNPSIARPNNTSLEVFKTTLRYTGDSLSLRSMDVFRISTIDSSSFRLPKTKNMSWKMQVGLRSQSLSCTECLVASVAGGVGTSISLASHWQFYALIKAGLQNNRNNQGTLYLLPEVGAFLNLLDNWKIAASYEYEHFVNGTETQFDLYKIESRFGSSKYWDFRISYQKRQDEQLMASLWFYL